MCLALCMQEVLIMTAADADSADNAFTMSSAGYADMLVKGVILASLSFSGGTNTPNSLTVQTQLILILTRGLVFILVCFHSLPP